MLGDNTYFNTIHFGLNRGLMLHIYRMVVSPSLSFLLLPTILYNCIIWFIYYNVAITQSERKTC